MRETPTILAIEALLTPRPRHFLISASLPSSLKLNEPLGRPRILSLALAAASPSLVPRFFVLREIPGDTLTGIRDRAMLTFAYCSGGRRRSEIPNAQWEHIRWAPRGFHLYIPRSKGDQTGKGFWVAAYGLAFRMPRLWLDVSGIESGPIFRTIQPDGDIGGKALEPDSIYRIFRSHFRNAGLGPSFSPHSSRAGFVVDACRRGVDIQSIRDLTGHGDLRSIQPCMRRGKLEKNPGARLISHPRLT